MRRRHSSSHSLRARLTYHAAVTTEATPDRKAPTAASWSDDMRGDHGSATRTKTVLWSGTRRVRRMTSPPLELLSSEVLPSMAVNVEAEPEAHPSNRPTWSYSPSQPQS